jgi:hypothetical protein
MKMEIQIHPEHLMATKQAKSRNRHQTFLDNKKIIALTDLPPSSFPQADAVKK